MDEVHGRANGAEGTAQIRDRLGFLIPFCCAEHRRTLWIRPAGERQGCRSSVVGTGVPSTDPHKDRGAQGIPEGDDTVGCHFFSSLFFGQAKKRVIQLIMNGIKIENNLSQTTVCL